LGIIEKKGVFKGGKVGDSRVKTVSTGLRPFFLVLLVLAAGDFLSAQTADRIDQILAVPKMSYAMASSVVLPAAGLINEDSSVEGAFAEARSRNFLPAGAAAEDAIPLGELSFLIMSAFDMKSGFMYALFPGSRYAYRELVYRNLIQGRNDPAITVSGVRFLRIIDRVLDYRGE
jgi:hypothetical protein